MQNYLHVSDRTRALLINFGAPSLQYRRVEPRAKSLDGINHVNAINLIEENKKTTSP